MAGKSFLVRVPALLLSLPFLRADLYRIVMDRSLGFRRACLHPAPRDMAAGFRRYPNHFLQGNRRDFPADLPARSKINIEIASGQKVIAR
jgi:hypothetical protein